MFLWGHRGCRGIAGIAENTIEAFEWAISAGVAGLEFDVQVSLDGVPVVFHDETLARLTDGRDERVVEHLTWQQLANVELNAKARVPALVELLKFPEQVVMNLEIKTTAAVRPVLDFVEQNRLNDWIISSFHFEALELTRQRLPEQAIGFLLECQPFETKDECFERADRGIAALRPERLHIDDNLVDEWLARRGELKGSVHVWTVNSRSRIDQLKSIGVVGVFTDDVRVAR